jgi:hypothetical protein
MEDIKDYAIDGLKHLKGTDPYACDIQHEIFNTDYFLIGYKACEEWLEHNVGTWKAIQIIQDYEKFHFGDVTTDLSNPEKVCNMYVYIAGEELLGKSEHLGEIWNERVTDKDLQIIINEIS